MNNTYGTVKPTILKDINNEVEIFYQYREYRNSEAGNFVKLDTPSSFLVPKSVTDSDSGAEDVLPGMFDFRLPVNHFGKRGFYTVYIRPKETTYTIYDIGTLVAYPDVKGIVLNAPSVSNNSLVGCRIDYLDDNGMRTEDSCLITSNNSCDVVSTYTSNSNGYRLSVTGSLMFLTVTPSSNPIFKANETPNIGRAGMRIIVSNTLFDPTMLEIEIVEHDADTITTLLDGNQITNLEKQLVNTYNEDGELFAQHEYVDIKDSYTHRELFRIRKNRKDNIDNSTDYNQLINK